jgi:hypothetical protein
MMTSGCAGLGAGTFALIPTFANLAGPTNAVGVSVTNAMKTIFGLNSGSGLNHYAITGATSGALIGGCYSGYTGYLSINCEDITS